ncbi:MAG: hypothetical protein RRB13_01795 [bacterium]|nr:hypothetical protein [bacterium]
MRLKALILAFLGMVMAAPAWAFEAEVGAQLKQDQYWQRESLLQGRSLDYRQSEHSQFGLIGFGLGAHYFSVQGERVTLEGYNGAGDQLQAQSYEVVTPRWDFRHSNLELSLWRRFESPTESGGSYQKDWSEPGVYATDHFAIKTEKNREFFEVNGGVDLDRRLATGGQIERRQYPWYEFALGAYNSKQKGWRSYSRKRRQEYPQIDPDTAEFLYGFEYYDRRPVEPGPEAYWKQFRIAFDRISLVGTTGIEAKVESDFSFFLWDSQNQFGFALIGRNLKVTYDSEDKSAPYRVESSSGQLLQRYEYKGETQIWGSPLLLKWMYRYTDSPFLADYRQDMARISLAFDY